MPIYKIKFNEWGYDQYDSFIVRAKDEKEAIETLLKEYPKSETWKNVEWESGQVVSEVPVEGESEIILGSFNAG